MSKKLIVPALIAFAFSVGVATAEAQSTAPVTGKPAAASSAKAGKKDSAKKTQHKKKHDDASKTAH